MSHTLWRCEAQTGASCLHTNAVLHSNNASYGCREAASDWGLQCMRYEIRDISPPAGVRAAMELQVMLHISRA